MATLKEFLMKEVVPSEAVVEAFAELAGFPLDEEYSSFDYERYREGILGVYDDYGGNVGKAIIEKTHGDYKSFLKEEIDNINVAIDEYVSAYGEGVPFDSLRQFVEKVASVFVDVIVDVLKGL